MGKENKNSGFINAMYLGIGSLFLYMALLQIASMSNGHTGRESAFWITVRLLTPFIQITASVYFLKNYFKS